MEIETEEEYNARMEREDEVRQAYLDSFDAEAKRESD